jgi:hypothetical protein
MQPTTAMMRATLVVLVVSFEPRIASSEMFTFCSHLRGMAQKTQRHREPESHLTPITRTDVTAEAIARRGYENLELCCRFYCKDSSVSQCIGKDERPATAQPTITGSPAGGAADINACEERSENYQTMIDLKVFLSQEVRNYRRMRQFSIMLNPAIESSHIEMINGKGFDMTKSEAVRVSEIKMKPPVGSAIENIKGDEDVGSYTVRNMEMELNDEGESRETLTDFKFSWTMDTITITPTGQLEIILEGVYRYWTMVGLRRFLTEELEEYDTLGRFSVLLRPLIEKSDMIIIIGEALGEGHDGRRTSTITIDQLDGADTRHISNDGGEKLYNIGDINVEISGDHKSETTLEDCEISWTEGYIRITSRGLLVFNIEPSSSWV